MTHIALVDDETNILTSVSLGLESEGFKVDTYLNGEEALAGLEKVKYDLGLFDIKMPRMNGNELLMRIRSSKNLELKNVDGEIIGLNTGCGDRWTSRKWPNNSWLTLINLLQKEGYTVLLLGGKDEDEQNKKLSGESGAEYMGFYSLNNSFLWWQNAML